MNETPQLPVENPGRNRTVVRAVTTGALGVLAVLLLTGGGWALWVDRVDRDAGGFVSTRPLHVSTATFAIVGDLRGDGPGWLYGSSVLGDARVRVDSQTGNALFVGIARKADVSRYLAGTGFATIDHFGTSAATTHPGRAPAVPTGTSMWAASTTGTGQLTLPWRPRSGEWSIVMMNAGAGPVVDVRGTLAAKLPLLPWLAAALLVAGLAVGSVDVRLARRLIRGLQRPPAAGQHSPEPQPGVAVGAPT